MDREDGAGRRRSWSVARIIWRANRWWAALWAALIVASAALTVLGAVAFGQVVGAVPDAAGAGLGSTAGDRLLSASIVASGVYLLLHATLNGTSALDRVLGRRLEAHLQLEALEFAERVEGLATLEDPAVRDVLAAVREVETAVHPAGAVMRSLQIIAVGALMSVTAAVVLATFHWWVPFVLLTGWVLQDLWGVIHQRTLQSGQEQLEHLQRFEAYRSLAVDAPAAKEVRVFGLGGWLSERAERHWRAAMATVWRARRVPRLLVVAIVVAQWCANASVAWLLVRAGATGELSLEQVAIYLGVGMAGPIMNLYQPYAVMVFRHAAQPIRRLAALELPAAEVASARGQVDERLPLRDVRFRGVRFRYPGSDRDALSHLDLDIPAGRSVAIVGENGAGKTTLVKLLTRLYEPTAGSITVDGVPLETLDVTAWRRRIAVVFQDYVRYPASLRDNVAFGRIGARCADGQLAQPAQDAGMASLVASLPDRWDTLLARELGGTDLSGGQWQRVALARALFGVRAGAGVLILDEPTASLDVRMEAELFDRFLELTRGVTTVLISHRFSTVRRADLIYVVEHGRAIEHGSHDALLAAGGRYAEMFALQASPYVTARVADA